MVPPAVVQGMQAVTENRHEGSVSVSMSMSISMLMSVSVSISMLMSVSMSVSMLMSVPVSMSMLMSVSVSVSVSMSTSRALSHPTQDTTCSLRSAKKKKKCLKQEWVGMAIKGGRCGEGGKGRGEG